MYFSPSTAEELPDASASFLLGAPFDRKEQKMGLGPETLGAHSWGSAPLPIVPTPDPSRLPSPDAGGVSAPFLQGSGAPASAMDDGDDGSLASSLSPSSDDEGVRAAQWGAEDSEGEGDAFINDRGACEFVHDSEEEGDLTPPPRPPV